MMIIYKNDYVLMKKVSKIIYNVIMLLVLCNNCVTNLGFRINQ